MSKPNPTGWLVAQGGVTTPQVSCALFGGEAENEREAKRIAAKLNEADYFIFYYWPTGECAPHMSHKMITVKIPDPIVEVKEIQD